MEAPSTYNAQAKAAQRSPGIVSSLTKGGDMKTLDWIHTIFLLYSGAHNSINAWHRAENFIFFIFVFVGILSVELMLWSTYQHWKDGRFVGKMITIAKWATVLALFYATAGILAQAQAGSTNEWLTMYYQWILPTSAPAMFVFAFWIQTSDPIMKAQRDAVAFEKMIEVENARDGLEQKRLELDYKRDMRRIKAHVHKQKMMALIKESLSRRTRLILKKAMQIEFPRILTKAGVPVEDINISRLTLFPRFRNGSGPKKKIKPGNGKKSLT